MARRRNWSYSNYGRKTKRKNKYTEAEKIAFRLGQEQKVVKSLNSNKESRVRDAYIKGLGSVGKREKKSLYGD